MEHRAKGEDPHDWDIVLQDLHESFQETLELLRKHAEEEGIDLDAIEAWFASRGMGRRGRRGGGSR